MRCVYRSPFCDGALFEQERHCVYDPSSAASDLTAGMCLK